MRIVVGGERRKFIAQRKRSCNAPAKFDEILFAREERNACDEPRGDLRGRRVECGAQRDLAIVHDGEQLAGRERIVGALNVRAIDPKVTATETVRGAASNTERRIHSLHRIGDRSDARLFRVSKVIT
jgi:hypothetical protein